MSRAHIGFVAYTSFNNKRSLTEPDKTSVSFVSSEKKYKCRFILYALVIIINNRSYCINAMLSKY